MSQPRYGSGSTVGENMATGAVASAGVGALGGAAWRAGRVRRVAGERLASDNAGYARVRRMADDFDRAERSKRREAKAQTRVAERRESLTARTRARLTPAAPGKGGKERYTEAGRTSWVGVDGQRRRGNGVYPTRRLWTLDAAAEGNREWARAFRASADQSRADAVTAARMSEGMKARFGQGTAMAAQGRRIARIGRPLALLGGAGAVGLGVGAELKRDARMPSRKRKATPAAPNVVDMARYRSMGGVPDERGAALVDRDGNRKALQANSGAQWLRAQRRTS